MLDPGLANLLKAIIVTRSTAHSIEIVRNNRMGCVGHRKKIHRRVSGITRGRAHAQTDLSPAASKLSQASYFTYVARNDIGSRVKTFGRTLPRHTARQQHYKRKQEERSF